ncbi:ATP-binding protein [Amycolatopsis thermophila]|uniref:Anti-sigma regulatory factor (Ser/Thr protein kinase) n=1 Tax=Amycolatopsis thermophila TaxID=206084 RepID=A0ABU0F156_9PSEU|nr:ATP-binding protein [Amycolatopsis thermophila]MDQ0381238.1 anti-sigma regulatory factor (Ser/Thr protein kinase) [Amycolatopsis thermophila]
MTTHSMTDTVEPPLTLELGPGSLPPLVAVRHWAARALSDLGEDHLAAVQLVATELLTNAYAHGGGAGRLRLRRDADPCRIRIEVDDHSAVHPVPARPGPGEPGGRGLAMVTKLTDDWGSRPRDGGKTVWAAIDCAAYPWDPCA